MVELPALIRILEGGSMPKLCSWELRERVVSAVESGASRREAADWINSRLMDHVPRPSLSLPACAGVRWSRLST